MRRLRRALVAPVKRAVQFINTKHDHYRGGVVAGKLREDVRTCAYPDIQVMWDLILKRSATPPTAATVNAAAAAPLREDKRLIKKARKRSTSCMNKNCWARCISRSRSSI